MKFAAPYQINCPINYENIDEFNIKFTETSSFEELRDFIKMYPTHRINIEFTEENYDVDRIIKFCQDFDNIYIRIHQWELRYLDSYEKNDIKYFFDYTISIYSYSLLEWVLNHKVKGVYITDDLTYNLEEVYKQCSERGIELRTILNRIPATSPLSFSCPSVQIYRPQDYDFLSQYYSVGEFSYDEKYDWTKTEILYKKWFIEHSCEYDLEFINFDLKIPYPPQSVPPELTRLRSVCKHRCTMSSQNICSKCRRFLLMGYKNADNNLIYTNSEYGLRPLEEIVENILLSKENNTES